MVVVTSLLLTKKIPKIHNKYITGPDLMGPGRNYLHKYPSKNKLQVVTTTAVA